MRGGFASYTKTGRNIALGRSFGTAMARGGSSRSSSRSNENSEEPSCFITFMFLLMCALLLQSITEALKEKQLQPQ
jgi:hypothetical protein